MAEIIEIQENSNSQWNPYVGEETYELLRSNRDLVNSDRTLNQKGDRVLDETLRIMQMCGNPTKDTNNETGIVIGYVQSGKTLSFTTLAALARDNHYQTIIIIGGTTTNLLNQSTLRLRKDLRIDSRQPFEQKWIQITNPETQEDFDTITNALTQWANPKSQKDKCKTVLITVMKNGNRLKNLTNLLTGMNLNRVPTLIIDDEGDQASLNTKAASAAKEGKKIDDLTEDQASTIYRRINELRNIFPHHTFLQYTATPQANLFINIMDRLSPNFIKLLTPGDDYTGGITFFRENPNLIVKIPPSELPTNQILYEPPNSLLEALRLFYLGVTAGAVLESDRLPGQHNRSMLIHPSRLQGDHNTFYRWVQSIKGSWIRLLDGEDNEDKAELLKEFRLAYEDLQLTVANLPSFEQLINSELVRWIQDTHIVKVNSSNGKTPNIAWNSSFAWILVGGQSMDRGFTVEGLTVTYMPRNIGVGNVDTIQQRARFLGYKKSYLGYCRVFLDEETIDSYKDIIEHEEDVREQLNDFNINNRHLNEWERKAVLDEMLNLTRANVLYDDLERNRFGNEWFRIKAPHDTEQYIITNRETVFNFLNPKATSFIEDQGHQKRTKEQRHLVATFSLKDCLDNLLNTLRFTRESDSSAYSSLRGILKQYLKDKPDENCLIYLMSTNNIQNWTGRERRLNSKGEIQQLFQGRNPRVGDIIYPGDIEIKNDDILTIQIHLLDLKNTTYTNVPTLAIWIPEHMGKDIIRQKQV